MIEQAIKKLVNQEDLTYSQARQVMDELMSGQPFRLSLPAI